jgi:aspartyl-tRNA synthetase
VEKMEIHLKERKTIREMVTSSPDLSVVLGGFLKHKRNFGKKLIFGLLQDGTGEIQIVFSLAELGQEALDRISALPLQSVCSIEGTLQPNTDSSKKPEVLVHNFEVLSLSGTDYPIDLGIGTDSSLDLRLNWRFLDLRDERRRTILYMLSDFEKHSRNFFYRNGLIEIHSPKIMGAASESGAEVFSLDYFETKAFLAQSPQFYKQMAIASGFDRVFEIAPAYRAEKSYTNRHLTEFVSLDVELGYIESVDDVMAFEEQWIASVLCSLREEWNSALKRLFGFEIHVPSLPFPRISMTDAIERVLDEGVAVQRGGDLPSEGEKALGRYIYREYGHPFVFVTDFPFTVRPFYHHKKNPAISNSYDLLWNGVEITTGAQREHRYEILKNQALEKGLDAEGLKHYLDFFRFGCPPHGGFGLGTARFMMSLLNLDNIREAVLLPRDPKRITP